jgi:hypothetical protein
VCGLEAVLKATGQRFGEVEAERMGSEATRIADRDDMSMILAAASSKNR